MESPLASSSTSPPPKIITSARFYARPISNDGSNNCTPLSNREVDDLLAALSGEGDPKLLEDFFCGAMLVFLESEEKEMVEYLEFFKMVYALWGTERWTSFCTKLMTFPPIRTRLIHLLDTSLFLLSFKVLPFILDLSVYVIDRRTHGETLQIFEKRMKLAEKELRGEVKSKGNGTEGKEKKKGYSMWSPLLLKEKETPWLRETCKLEFLPGSIMITLGGMMKEDKIKPQEQPSIDSKPSHPSHPRRPLKPCAGHRISPLIARSKTVKEFIMGLAMLGGNGEMVRKFVEYIQGYGGSIITSRGFFFAELLEGHHSTDFFWPSTSIVCADTENIGVLITEGFTIDYHLAPREFSVVTVNKPKAVESGAVIKIDAGSDKMCLRIPGDIERVREWLCGKGVEVAKGLVAEQQVQEGKKRRVKKKRRTVVHARK